MTGIKIRNLSKIFMLKKKEVPVFEGMDLFVEKQSFVTIVGKSGCGKTTLLRILCGLEEKSGGEVLYMENGRECGKCPKMSIVFQEPRLMPWLTVKQNMAFSLENENDSGKVESTVNKYLEILGLDGFKDAYPSQISGGMAQRVALGRTLCYEPDVILMDEPLGALDAYNRKILQDELIHIFNSCKKTIVFVTHDIEEALYLGQRLIVIDDGKIMEDIDIKENYPRDIHSAKFSRLREKAMNTIMDSKNKLAVAQ